MKIWFAANIPEKSYGGVARSMRELARHMEQNGHHAAIIYRSRYIGNNYLLYALQLAIRLLISSAAAPDCIIARSTDSSACLAVRQIFRLKTRIILHNHGWEEHVYEYEKRLPASIVSSPTTWKATIIRFNLLRYTLQSCDMCISGTVDEIRWLAARYPEQRKKLAYAPNGVYKRSSCYWHNTTERPLHFLCIGPPTWKKNLTYSIALFAAIHNRDPRARLYLIGTGAENIHILFSLVNIPDESFVHVSQENPESMNTWYTACPNMLACSRYEGGHSFAVLEALSYGMLVFASPIPSHKEIIRHCHNGFLLSCSNAKKDAQQVLNACTRDAETADIRMRAYRTSQRNAWQRQAKRLEKLL